MKVFVLSAIAAGCALSAQALADNYSCQADLVTRHGEVVSSSIGDGFSRRQACQNALNQCQDDLITFQQQGLYRYARCLINDGGPGWPVPPGPVTPVPPGPFPPNPGPFPPNPGPFPPGPGNYFEVSCASYDFNVNYCYVGRNAYAVRLLQRFSSADCSLNRTYGLQGDYLWVDRGCRGAFAVYAR